MKLIALLSWFDEPVELLRECVASLGFCDHLVAVDGCYALYPAASCRSSRLQTNAIITTAIKTRLPLSLHIPSGPWQGNEVEKRSAMFRYGNALAEPGDWFLVIDGDETVAQADLGLKRVLEDCPEDVAMFKLVGWAQDQNLVRGLFRADPTLRVEGAHYRYIVGHGDERRVLWGNVEVDREETAFNAGHLLMVRHQRHRRPDDRLQAANRYYEARDQAYIERVSWSHSL